MMMKILRAFGQSDEVEDSLIDPSGHVNELYPINIAIISTTIIETFSPEKTY